MARTTAQVRKDIDAEREQLASALDELRSSLGNAADIGGKLKSKLPVVAGAAASAGFVLAGGIGATARYFARRGREEKRTLFRRG
ncbi:MAG TPA: DUF3618 domain-containing protein [Gaiellaceae bacterium]|nr:DUF3618 domain-containing protein [Gaiellaceae bacterium]